MNKVDDAWLGGRREVRKRRGEEKWRMRILSASLLTHWFRIDDSGWDETELSRIKHPSPLWTREDAHRYVSKVSREEGTNEREKDCVINVETFPYSWECSHKSPVQHPCILASWHPCILVSGWEESPSGNIQGPVPQNTLWLAQED